MSDLAQRITDLQAVAEDARQRRAVAVHQKAVALAGIQNAEAALQSEFGVTPEQAPALLAQFQEAIQQEMVNIQAALAAAQGGPE